MSVDGMDKMQIIFSSMFSTKININVLFQFNVFTSSVDEIKVTIS